MDRGVQNQASTHDKGLGFNIGPPFTSKIMQDSIPTNFKIPYLESYDGLGYPLDHLESFQTLMLLCQVTDAVLYQALSLILKGMARHWYSSLKPGFIDSFKELANYLPPTSPTANDVIRGRTI